MSTPPPLPKSRIEALTDGIFAVTMTLLVLDLRLPEAPANPDRMVDALAALVPRVDDYAISFLVLCVFWMAHMSLARLLHGVDRSFVWQNLLFLLFTTFVPPLTAFVDHNASRPEAALVYGFNLLAIIGLEAALWRRGLYRLAGLPPDEATPMWRVARRRSLFAGAVVVTGIILALLEIELRTEVALAPYVYLLVLAAGMLRPVIRRHVAAPDDGGGGAGGRP
jgi:uncharacterized membrane protein